MIALSFGRVDDLGRAVYAWNPSNYADVFNPLYVPVLVRSVAYALATAALCMLIGYPVAYYIARYGGRSRPADRGAGDPLLRQLPGPHLRLGRAALGRGVRQHVLGTLGAHRQGLRMLNTPYAVIGGLVYGYLVFMILPSMPRWSG